VRESAVGLVAEDLHSGYAAADFGRSIGGGVIDDDGFIRNATKRVAEFIVKSFAGRGVATRFVAVRFGNVLGSSGSVLEIFQEQIAKGGPITVTHPDVTRYFMTVEEAAQLILQAASMALGGEIFILKMGDPVKIVEMAKNLILLSGLEPGKDIEIRITGLKQGEKLDEERVGRRQLQRVRAPFDPDPAPRRRPRRGHREPCPGSGDSHPHGQCQDLGGKAEGNDADLRPRPGPPDPRLGT